MASYAEGSLNRSASLYTAARPTGEYHPPAPLQPDLIDCSIVAFSAPEIGMHRSATWPGPHVQLVKSVNGSENEEFSLWQCQKRTQRRKTPLHTITLLHESYNRSLLR